MSLGLLVARFGDFLGQQLPPMADASQPQAVFPAELSRIRNMLNHHLIALLMLARVDGETIEAEREHILSYCLNCLADAGIVPDPEERTALVAHIREFKPARAQLELALDRLEREPKARIAALIDAAQRVVDADGVRRPYELQMLAQMAQELAAI